MSSCMVLWRHMSGMALFLAGSIFLVINHSARTRIFELFNLKYSYCIILDDQWHDCGPFGGYNFVAIIFWAGVSACLWTFGFIFLRVWYWYGIKRKNSYGVNISALRVYLIYVYQKLEWNLHRLECEVLSRLDQDKRKSVTPSIRLMIKLFLRRKLQSEKVTKNS